MAHFSDFTKGFDQIGANINDATNSKKGFFDEIGERLHDATKLLANQHNNMTKKLDGVTTPSTFDSCKDEYSNNKGLSIDERKSAFAKCVANINKKNVQKCNFPPPDDEYYKDKKCKWVFADDKVICGY